VGKAATGATSIAIANKNSRWTGYAFAAEQRLLTLRASSTRIDAWLCVWSRLTPSRSNLIKPSSYWAKLQKKPFDDSACACIPTRSSQESLTWDFIAPHGLDSQRAGHPAISRLWRSIAKSPSRHPPLDSAAPMKSHAFAQRGNEKFTTSLAPASFLAPRCSGQAG